MAQHIFRSYRFIIIAVTAIMLILIIKTSTDHHTSATENKHYTADDVNINLAGQSNDDIPSGKVAIIEDSSKVVESPTTSAAALSAAASADGKKTSSASSEVCDKDHQYIVIVDAGSTGSRVHVYEFDVCTSPPSLVHETFDMLKPGLSSYPDDANGAALSLNPLLDLAVETIPKKFRDCSPIAVKATAGLRLLGADLSTAILKEVRSHLETNYPFPIVDDKDAISIMGGDDEGVYAWITTNYLLGNIGAPERLPTAAVFDLGGGSTQIVFEPTFANKNEKMIDGEHKYELEFGSEKYTLYQFSHLGYGLMQGRNKINSLLINTSLKNEVVTADELATGNVELVSPCLPPNTTFSDKVKMEDGTSYSVTFKGPKTPAGPQCRYLADKILNKDAVCESKPCSFNGVHQPSLVKTFNEHNDLYVFSYFYDKTQPLGMPLSFSLNELKDLARMVCNGEEVWQSVLSGVEGGVEELQKAPEYCLDLSFQVSLLHTGYDIPLHRELKTAQTLAGNEIGWCLGNALSVLDGNNWKCKVNQLE
ncbi:Guanosine-diphosphatase [Hanseniaspora osmophila]